MSDVQSRDDPDIKRDIRELIDEVIPQPDRWLDTPNAQLGGSKPKDLIWDPQGNLQETTEWVRDLVRAVKHGMFS